MKSEIKAYVFDLDGTLVESHRTIYLAMAAAFDKLNIEYSLSQNEFNKNIGLHFEDIFERYSIKVPDFDKFLRIYKSNYFNFINESVLYRDVENTIINLRNSGNFIALLTTKAQDQADLIMRHFNLDKYFAVIMGRREGIAHKPDPQPLLLICSELGISPRNCVMVGDTELDIQCGKSAGSKTCALTYGYRPIEILQQENPDFVFNHFSDILTISH